MPRSRPKDGKSAVWTLSYWIRGTRLSGYETIDVSPETNITGLRKLIVQSSSLSVPPGSIDVYQVPENRVPDDDSMEDALGSLSVAGLGKTLRAARELSSIFKLPIPQKQLHLVIDIPQDVHCWLRGAGRGASFEALGVQETVDRLKMNIKNQEPHLADIPASRIRLYKILCEDSSLDECLDTRGEGQLLDGPHLIQTIFKDVPFRATPRVVVEWTEEETFRPPPSSHRPTGNGNPITEARENFLRNCPKESPSTSGTPTSFKTRQAGPRFVPCGRPRDHEGQPEDTIPPILLHEVFGQFVDDCRNFEVEAKDDRLAFDLKIAMTKMYDKEDDRVNGINEVLRRNGVHFNISKIAKTDFMPDGTISVRGHNYAIAEFKNEVGSTGAEPYFQAIGYYVESTREYAPKHPNSPLPCMFLLVFGPYMVFAAAAWNLRPTVQVLSNPITFCFHPTDTDNHLNNARHMAAFRKALDSLDEYYRSLPTPFTSTVNTGLPPQLFPHKTTYRSLRDKATRTFEYEKEIVANKLVYFAKEHDTNEQICVKFTRTYSRDAHEYLVTLGHAPALRGYERLPGGWIMVVLDALTEFETLAQRKQPLPPSFFENMSETMGKFHEALFVHGDVRDVNIMVSKADERKFMMIDFDWAGRIGEARYPAGVNSETIKRPHHELDRKLIEKEHDLFMLDYLTRLFEVKD